jgi:Mg2+ and Co2+ transporter CorA
MDNALLFERDAVEEVDWAEGIPRLGRSSVLWVDLERPSDEELRHLGDALELQEDSLRDLAQPERRGSTFGDYGEYLHVTMLAPGDHGLIRVACLVAERWLVTIRDAPLEVVETFRVRASGSGEMGRLDGLAFLANLVEWVLGSYFEAFERVEVALEEVDAAAMSGEIAGRDEVIGRLVEVRREIAGLRRALTSHRETILSLTRPELEAIASSSSAERFASLRDRLEEAVQAARDSRESVVGSFDVLIASTGQRTNDIMKVLTLASVLILPGTLLAGVMGMNFRLGLFDDPVYFWAVIGAMAALAIVTLLVARTRAWI